MRTRSGATSIIESPAPDHVRSSYDKKRDREWISINTFTLLKNIPDSLRRKWLTLSELSDYLRCGGANLVTNELVKYAMRKDYVGIFQFQR